MDEKDKRIQELEEQLQQQEERIASRLLNALRELSYGVKIPNFQVRVHVPMPLDGNSDEPVKTYALDRYHVEGWFENLADAFEQSCSWNAVDEAKQTAQELARELTTMTILNQQYRQALANCIRTMVRWGNEEDGIPEESYPYFTDALRVLGVKTKKVGFNPVTGEVINKLEYPADVQSYNLVNAIDEEDKEE